VNATADRARRLSSLDTGAVDGRRNHASARCGNGAARPVSLGMHGLRPRNEG